MRRLNRNLLLGAALLTILCVFADASLGLSTGVAHLAPFLLVLVPLLRGCYIGERRLANLRRSARPSRRRLPGRPALHRARVFGMPRGSELLGRSLAVRPPPAVLAQL